MEQMIDKATKVLEAIADKLWVLWAKCLVPNISCQFRVEAEAKAQDEQDRKLRDEAECIIEEKLARAVICLGRNKDLWSQRSKYKSYGALRGCDLGVRDCLQVYCGK